MIEFFQILFEVITQPVFSDVRVVMAVEPVTTTLAVITAVASILKGANFKKTQHLTFDQAAAQARTIRPSFVELWISKYGLNEKTVSAQAIKLVNYMRTRDGQASWNIMAGTIANDVQNAIAQYAFSNPTQLINYCSEVWILFVLMNYDTSRDYEWPAELVARTKEVFGMDLSQPAKSTGTATGTKAIGGAIDSLVNGVKTLFGVEDAASSGGTGGNNEGISQSTILLGLGLILVLIIIFKK